MKRFAGIVFLAVLISGSSQAGATISPDMTQPTARLSAPRLLTSTNFTVRLTVHNGRICKFFSKPVKLSGFATTVPCRNGTLTRTINPGYIAPTFLYYNREYGENFVVVGVTVTGTRGTAASAQAIVYVSSRP